MNARPGASPRPPFAFVVHHSSFIIHHSAFSNHLTPLAPMLTPAPPKDRRRRRGRRIKPSAALPAPPATTVTVLSVTLVPGQENALDFEFSAPVTCDGSGSPAVVVTDTNIGPAPALFSTQVSAAVVRFEWEGVVLLAAGMHWEITAVPACLDFPPGATMP